MTRWRDAWTWLLLLGADLRVLRTARRLHRRGGVGMRAILIRYEDDGERAFGTFVLVGGHRSFICHTIERPWLDNVPFKSCVPPDEYTLEPHVSPRFGHCLKITGCEPARTHCLFHPANVVENVTGCVGPGRRRGDLHGEPAVIDSRSAMNELLELVTEPIPLSILTAA